MATDDNEERFRIFTNALLAVEETVHRSGNVTLYTPDALQDILEKFCDIIATHLEAQSCTIQLKVHDIASCKFIAAMTSNPNLPEYTSKTEGRSDDDIDRIREYRGRMVQEFRQRWEAAGGDYEPPPPGPAKNDPTRRNTVLRTPGTFPYCVYPKGAMWLVAANKTSPWTPFLDWLITDLRVGVTAEIVQEKSPRVRDPFTIRKSRAFRKLGPVDPWLWTNQRPASMTPEGSPRYFLNFYAVPIRIHAGGDVIGILKIENKGFAYRDADANDRDTEPIDPLRQLHDALNKVVRTPHHSGDFQAMRNALAEQVESAKNDAKRFDTEQGKPSVLSLVVLAWDLSQCASKKPKATIEQFLTASYGEPIVGGDVPPIQVLFDKIDEEDAFFLRQTPATGERPDLDVVSAFYETLNTEMSARSTAISVKKQLQQAIGKAWSTEKPVEIHSADPSYPDFFYRVTGSHGGIPFKFHVQVCPTAAQSADVDMLVNYYEMPEERAKKYRTVHLHQESYADLDGEHIAGTDRVIHLRTDRLAARIQALTYAFPVPPFLATDSRKLSWAALEIGKLIERQISYRGTHSAPTVPLTADDFFRIPISDLSFVDAIRGQYENADVLRESLRYHLPNLCKDLDFTWGIEHSQRIKSLRSYFDRVGQSHRAEYDALIAIWAYLLCTKTRDDELEKIGSAATRMPGLLREFVDRFEKVFVSEKRIDFPDWKTDAVKWMDAPELIYPDLRFSAPAMNLPREELREKALRCLRHNLSHCPTGVGQQDLRADFEESKLVDLLFRRYDAFIVRATSLYLQLRNEGLKKGYVDFYRQTRDILEWLRNRFEVLEEQVTRAPQNSSPIGLLSETIGKLRVEVLSLSTSNLAEKFAEEKPTNEELLRFSVQGIYKRIRTLATVSGNQCSPALLNWENGRFDYLGARLRCLFKNQVFATYEEVWKRGDPFRLKGAAPQSGSRQRWICLRTKVHAGETGYNAWQVSALMDPLAISDSYWEDNAYTLNTLRDILTMAHRQWSNNDDVRTYDSVAQNRLKLREQYSAWFSHATKLLEQQPAACPPRKQRLFGEYLGEWALDVLVRILKEDAKPATAAADRLMTPDRFLEVLSRLEAFVKEASAYSVMVRRIISGQESGENYAPGGDLLMKASTSLYEWTCRFIKDTGERLEPEIRLIALKRLARHENIVKTERRYTLSPLVFMPEEIAAEIAELKSSVSGKDLARRDLAELEKIVRRIQGAQMDYLFDLPKGSDAPPLRGQSDVMDRILCYILLHGREAYELTGPLKEIENAYNLFYYVMSLVPVEIQIRTALADTMAEQYHRIYKIGSEALSETKIQQQRLIQIGQDLDVTDRIFEVQFEDYIAQKSI